MLTFGSPRSGACELLADGSSPSNLRPPCYYAHPASPCPNSPSPARTKNPLNPPPLAGSSGDCNSSTLGTAPPNGRHVTSADTLSPAFHHLAFFAPSLAQCPPKLPHLSCRKNVVARPANARSAPEPVSRREGLSPGCTRLISGGTMREFLSSPSPSPWFGARERELRWVWTASCLSIRDCCALSRRCALSFPLLPSGSEMMDPNFSFPTQWWSLRALPCPSFPLPHPEGSRALTSRNPNHSRLQNHFREPPPPLSCRHRVPPDQVRSTGAPRLPAQVCEACGRCWLGR